jgi:hypothetical protein
LKSLITFSAIIIFIANVSFGAVYYISPSGADTNPGTISSPVFTLNKAISLVSPGDTIFFRGGTYAYTSTQALAKSGTAADTICIFAYPGEYPILSWSTWAPSSSDRGAARGIYLTGDYYYIRGIDIGYAPDNGMKLEGSHNLIEHCAFHHNGDTGLQVGLKSNAANDGTKVCYNYILNCDSYLNVDPATNYENADGFACKLYPGVGNKFYGCRSWENCDDGWDLYETEYLIELDHCWTWHNGDPTVWGFTSFNGDGNGFKLGGAGVAGGHLVKNCIAFNNKETYSRGFHQNNNGSGITVYNCTAWGNTVNYGFNDAVTVTKVHCLKNNIAFDFYKNPAQSGAANAKLLAGTISQYNTWDTATGVTVTADDFISLAESDAMAARQADGSLPNNGFAKLKATSKAIDKGTDVGIPFIGSAPDLGAFEYNPLSAVKENATGEKGFYLHQNYPNPFNPSTTISCTLSKASYITLKVYAILGNEVASLFQGNKPAGTYQFRFNANGLPSGIYLFKLTSGNMSETRKMILMK